MVYNPFMARNGNPMTAEDVRKALRAQCDAAGTMSKWSDAHGVSIAYTCDVLAGRRDPGKAILAALGLRKTVKYERVRA